MQNRHRVGFHSKARAPDGAGSPTRFNACCREGTTPRDFSFPISLSQLSPPRLPTVQRCQNGSQRRCSETPHVSLGGHRTQRTECRATSLSRVDHESESDRQSLSQAREQAVTDGLESTERPDTSTRPTDRTHIRYRLPDTRGDDRRRRSDCLSEGQSSCGLDDNLDRWSGCSVLCNASSDVKGTRRTFNPVPSARLFANAAGSSNQYYSTAQLGAAWADSWVRCSSTPFFGPS